MIKIRSIIFIIAYFIIGTLSWGNHSIMLIFMLFFSFIFSYIFFRKNTEKLKLNFSIINLPFLSLTLLTCTFGNDFSRGLLYLIFVPISSILGYKYSLNQKKTTLFFSILFFLFISLIVLPNFQSYYYNKEIKKIAFPNVKVVNKSNKSIVLEKNKIILLDFWTTNCGICFEKFPDLEYISNKYKNNDNVLIYSINVPLRNEKLNETTKILDSLGYSFKKLYAVSQAEIEDSLKINSFPCLLIIKNNKIRYRGQLESNQSKYIYFNTEKIINKLLLEK